MPSVGAESQSDDETGQESTVIMRVSQSVHHRLKFAAVVDNKSQRELTDELLIEGLDRLAKKRGYDLPPRN